MGTQPWDDRDQRDSDLSGANLSRMTIQRTLFDGSTLDGAVFWRCDLRGSSIRQCYCAGANFEEAKLTGAYFTGSYLVGARFAKATGLTLPAGYELDADGVCKRVAP